MEEIVPCMIAKDTFVDLTVSNRIGSYVLAPMYVIRITVPCVFPEFTLRTVIRHLVAKSETCPTNSFVTGCCGLQEYIKHFPGFNDQTFLHDSNTVTDRPNHLHFMRDEQDCNAKLPIDIKQQAQESHSLSADQAQKSLRRRVEYPDDWPMLLQYQHAASVRQRAGLDIYSHVPADQLIRAAL